MISFISISAAITDSRLHIFVKFSKIINFTRPSHSEGPMCLQLDWCQKNCHSFTLQSLNFWKIKSASFFLILRRPTFFSFFFQKKGFLFFPFFLILRCRRFVVLRDFFLLFFSINRCIYRLLRVKRGFYVYLSILYW